MAAFIFCGMDSGLCRGQSEDQPAFAGVDCGKLQDVAEEGAVSFRVLAVEEDVGAGDHGASLTGRDGCWPAVINPACDCCFWAIPA